jgi:hypothetical protein
VKFLRQFLRRTSFYPTYKRLGHYPDFFYWKLRGKPPRPPHLVKQRLVKQYARQHGLRVLVETGTYYGEMIEGTKRDFDQIFSIEFDPRLARGARARFASAAHIHVLEGSSEMLIPQILCELTQPALFWLDAGYCAWNGKLADSSRLFSEIGAILSHRISNHAILIDDVVPFSGIDGTPDVRELMQHITTQFPSRKVSVDTGVLVIA